jgi:hypothetical protein
MFACLLALASWAGAPLDGRSQAWPFEVTDLSARERLVILVFGDGGTGGAGQGRVGHAMAVTCRDRRCDLAIMLGDNLYEDGVEVRIRDDAEASYREIIDQFELKFARPYRGLAELPGFHVWAVAGNHDYEAHAAGAQIAYSEFSPLWRMPAQYYTVPRLPPWIQLQAIHTDTSKRRDLNGLQVAAVRRALCAEGPARWKLAFGHHPIYNSGHHRDDSDERRTRALLEPVFRECGVHVYFSGHAHHQEHLTAPGFEQVIQGAAGKSKGSSRPPRSRAVRQRVFRQTFGFAVVEIDAERVRVDFYDVLNTRETSSSWELPTPEEIVRSYSWCASRDEVGRADREPTPCPTAGVRAGGPGGYLGMRLRSGANRPAR